MSDGPIAIVGASCRFPGAPDLESFWQLLASATDAISEVGSERWSTRFFFHPTRSEPGKSYSWAAGLISGIDQFEPAFFGISPREASQMDPQQRLLLELVWHAIEDSGSPAEKLCGSATGVYVGASTTDYSDLRIGDPASGDSYTLIGNSLSILANRVSYIYDLRGPSLTVDTACSSSLVALHHACEALRSGRIESAIVGGVNLLLSPYPFIGFCRAAMLSRRGRCFAFDERADGYVRGEGGAAIFLKPLAQAVADGDPIRALITGSGVNSDGRTIGLSLPSEAAQTALLRSVYRSAGIEPDELRFFEMHGTGTPAGDPVEAGAVGHALGRRRAEHLPIGSVKSNIGHLEAASGMAGLLKAALALDRGVVPPTLHSETPNQNIPFEGLNLRLVRRPEPIAPGERAFAGVNSFGFGGTNAHIVLAAPPRRPPAASEPAGAPQPPLLVSARSQGALRDLAQSWRDTLATTAAEDAPALLRAAARRRDHHPHRLVAFGGSPSETADALAAFLADPRSPAIVSGTAVREGGLAFAFSGNGAQWLGMGRDAYRHNAVFRAAVAETDGALQPALGWSVADRFASGLDEVALARADIAQPLLFACQIGIVAALRALGVEASAHLGHSVGEIAAAWAAGALTLASAARVVAARSRHQERTRGTGRMAALALGEAAAQDLIDAVGSPIEVAAINTTQSVTVSGPAEAIAQLGAEARRRGVAFRALDLDFAFHSRAMDAIRDDLLADLAGLAAQAPQAGLVSTVSGDFVGGRLLGAEYWWRNIRHPVRFAEATACLIERGYNIFVEIGPSPLLQAYLNDGLRSAEKPGRVLASLSRKDDPGDPFPPIAARCHAAGHDIAASAWFDGPAEPRGLPLYPWQRERFWFEKTVEDRDPANPVFEHPLLGFREDGAAPAWFNHIDQDVLPWLADHAVEGMPVFPAAAVIEMALAAARTQRAQAPVLELLDVELRRPLPFDKGRMREIRTALTPETGDWELSSRPRLSAEPLTVYAVARLSSAAARSPAAPSPPERTDGREVGAAEHYRLAARLGLDYGKRFRTVERVERVGADEVAVHLDPSVIGEALDAYLIHPALLDGALQGLLALLADRHAEFDGTSFLPWRFGRIRLIAPFGRVPRRAHIRLARLGTRSASADIMLFDEAGAALADLSDCWFRRVELTRRGALDERTVRIDLVPAPLAEEAAPDALAERLVRPGDDGEGDSAQREQALLLDALMAAAAYRTMRGFVEPGTPFAVEALIDSGSIALDSAPLVLRLLRLLEQFGAASEEGPDWRLETAHDLPEMAEIWRSLLAESPNLVGELSLVAALAEDLPSLLRGGPRPFEPWLASMVEHLLYASPTSASGIGRVCDALGEIAAAWPRGRALRIIEVGAGGATRRVLTRLAQSATAFSYLATTADPDMAARLAFTVAPVDGAAAQQWSPGVPDDLDGRRFDLVLAFNACARLQLDAASLSQLQAMLAPGGLFLAVEPEPNPLWDLVFGRQPGWWRDGGHAGDASPLRSAEDWRSELALAGFATAGAVQTAAGSWPIALLCGTAAAAPFATAAPAATPLPLLLIGGRDAAVLRDRLIAAGHPVTLAPGGPLPALSPGNAAAIVFLAEKPEEAPKETDIVTACAEGIAALARIAVQAAESHTALWVVTSGAQQPAAERCRAGLVGAALWGLARVLVNELPHLSLRLVDMPAEAGPEHLAARLAAELRAAGAESEIVWTAVGRHVLRLRRGLPARWAAASDAVGLSISQPGSLDALHWQKRPAQPPGPGEVAIDVEAAGLNFRDLMWAMGLLPEEALIDGFAGPTFGLECAGTVRAVGPGVAGLSVGERVAGFAPAALSRRVVTAADAVVAIPPDMDFAAAATIPVAFVTAIYALARLAKIAAGEYVLIHAAAGGVGLAAIQYARHRGAVVIATAGSAAKRAFLRLAGADHVLESRDLSFPDAVREITGGQGVDIVLNSLSGEAMEQSLAVLRPFGRFLELGKRDFYLNRHIHLRPLRQNISYFAIDVDQLPTRRPELARSLLSEVSAALAAGAIRPLAHRIFPFAEIDDSFRLMQASSHIGKLVLVPAGNAGMRRQEPPEIVLRRDGTYLVTGGLAGFGYEAAGWLAAHGAGSIALVGRRGAATPEAAERVAALTAAGAEVRVYAGDVGDAESLAGILAAIRASQPPLRGIVHAASAIGDALARDLEAARIAPLLRAKLGGAVLLDALTRDDPIELFLLFSSATTILGAPGQGVYVAANLAIEALARRRASAGRPALAVAWGPIADTGYLAERSDARDSLARRLGAKPMPARRALECLPALLAGGRPVAALAETSWNEARRFLPILAAPLFSDVRGDAAAAAADDSLVERLAGLDAAEAVDLLKTVVAEEAATILRLPPGSIDPLRPLSEIGMDSLMAVELRLALESRLRVDLPLVSLAEGTSIASIAGRLLNAVAVPPQAAELIGLAARYESAGASEVAEAVIREDRRSLDALPTAAK